MPPVNLVDAATGKTFSFDEETAATLVAGGRWTLESDQAAADRTGRATIASEYGGLRDKIKAGAATALSTATLGGSDALFRLASDEQARSDLAAAKAENPGSVAIGSLVGLAPALASGNAGALGSIARATPVGATARLGAFLSRTAPEAGLLAKVGRGAAGAAIEGGLQGIGTGVSDLALSDDPLTVEHIAGTLSNRFVTTGAVSGVLGGGFAAVEHGLSAAGRKLRAAKIADESAAAGSIPDDLAGLDKKQLTKLRDEELARVEAEMVPQRAQLGQDIAKYRDTAKIDQPWVAVATGSKADKLAARKAAARTARVARSAEDAAKAAEAEAASAESALARYGTEGVADDAARMAAEEAAMSARSAATTARAEAERATTEALEAGKRLERAKTKYPRWMTEQGKTYMEADKYLDRVLRNPKALAENPRLAKAALQQQEATLEQVIARKDELAVFHAFDTTGSRAAAMQKVPDALEANRALQQRIDALMKPSSERLTTLGKAIESYEPAKMTTRQKIGGALAFGATMSAASQVDVPGMSTIAPVLAAAAGSAVAGKLGGVMAKSASLARQRSIKAVDALLSGARAARRSAPVLSSQVLAATRFAPDEPKQPAAKGLDAAFEARSRELARMMAPGPDGKSTVRPHIRAQISDRFAPIAATAPHVADRLETFAVRRLEFLDGKRPRTLQIGMTKIKPTEMAIRAWARYVAAADDPSAIEERLAEGTITPEDAEVMRELYPERTAEIIRLVAQRLPELRGKLPYQKRLAMSIFTGQPVDASLEPRILRQLQRGHKNEPNSEGGTTAPTPQPAFGSVKRPEPTPAQQRAG